MAGIGRQRRVRHGALVALVVVVLGCIVSASADWDFPLILQRAENLYGPLGEGRHRILEWQQLLADGTELSEAERLQQVNTFFNERLRFDDDQRLWGQVDYWATPVEALRIGAGDCEDYAVAKYLTLRRLGVPAERLRITYVKALRLNQAHMVLTYYERPDAAPLVLDNLIEEILPASRRSDLLPVYAFNGEGLWLQGAGSEKRVGDSKRLSRWQDLLEKMNAEGFTMEKVQ